MVSATEVPADATATIEREMNAETAPDGTAARDVNLEKVEKKDEQPVEGHPAAAAPAAGDAPVAVAGGAATAEEKAIFLNEELLDGPYHVETINVESKGGPKNANADGTEGDTAELHPASESGKRLGFPVDEWTEKATAQASALKNLVLDGGSAMSKVIRRLSGKKDDFDSAEHSETGDEKPALEPVKEEHRDRGLPAKEGEHKDRQLKEKVTRWLAQKKNEIVGQVVESHPLEKEVATPEPADPKHVEDPGPQMKGRITVYTISGSQNCRAAKHFLRSRGLPYVEINLDAFPERRLDLEARTEKSSVPQIFFNNVFVGGFDELNSMNSADLGKLIKDVHETEVPADAPSLPVYGEDSTDEDNRKLDELAEIVRRLRAAVVVKDRFLRYRMHSNCFVGSEAIDFLVEDQYCEREEVCIIC